MNRWRHAAAALAAHLPCRPASVPQFACNCLVLAADGSNRWNEALTRQAKRAGIVFIERPGRA